MTPQLTNQHPDQQQTAHPPAHPDARINHVLEALRTTEPPAGLEQRIAARLAQAAEARQSSTLQTRQASTPQTRPLITTDIAAEPSLFTTILNAARNSKSLIPAIQRTARNPKSLLAVISTEARSAQRRDPRIPLAPASLYAAAATLTLLLTLTTITLLHHHAPTTTAQATLKAAPSQSTTATTTLTPTSSPSLEGAGLQSRRNTPTKNPALAAEGASLASTPCFEKAGLQSRRNALPCNAALAAEGISNPATTPPQARPLSVAPDPDTIALAETRAPSRPAPPMPLSSQEQLMLAATRPGQPIQLAELDIARAPSLRAAAEAREDANIRRYVRTLLAPFAVADELSSTIISQPQEISTAVPAPQPPTSLTN